MRLTIIIMTTMLLQVSAVSKAQKVSLNLKNASLVTLLQSIKQQTGYNFLYPSELKTKTKPVSIQVRNMELSEVLETCFRDQPFAYSVDENTIVIKEKEPSFLDNLIARFTNIDVRGKVLGDKDVPLEGATIVLKGTKRTTKTNARGEFNMENVEEDAVLVISYVGYKTQEIKLAKRDSGKEIIISMVAGTSDLEEVTVASNGYEDIPRERSTGSFEVITAKMLEHSSSPNLLQRLDGITTSIVFNNTQSPTNSGATARVNVPGRSGGITSPVYNGGYTIENMTIRGRNSFTSSAAAPLVVIDGIANAYDISLLNPDDVESITILKDAASASIWGSRAANGVLVIKTKRGKFNQPLNISFNTNFSVGEKFNLFYQKRMSVSDYIDLETYRFNQSKLSLPTPQPNTEGSTILYTPVYEILDAVKKGTLSAVEGNAQIDALRENDFRRDQEKYLLKNPVTQNYSLNLGGGTKKMAYTLNTGYSATQGNTINNSSNRINGAYNMQMNVLKNLSLNAGVTYSVSNTEGSGTLFINPPTGDVSTYAPSFMPYSRLADEAGNPLEVYLHRPGFLAALSNKFGNKILDNSYYPLNEFDESSNKSKNHNLGLMTDLKYRLNEMLSASLYYNYNLGMRSSEQFYSGDSYYMRDLINMYTNPTTLNRAIPLGGLLIPQRSTSHNQTIRGLVSFGKSWNQMHAINASAGLDIAENTGLAQPTTSYYGYDRETLKTSAVIFYTAYPLLYSNSSGGLPIQNPPQGQFVETIKRTVGQFFNIGYTYDSRYTLTSSVRKDGDNTFGNKTNRTGTPFYHFGAGWNIDRESFYHIAWLPLLKMRYTFGYNGNTNPGPTAEPFINLYPTAPNTLLPYATVGNPSNPQLRPERTGTHNLGLDFGLKGGRISGSIEYFVKKTTDLIGFSPINPSHGFGNANYNVASLYGKGIDLGVNSTILQSNKFSWSSNFHLSYNRVKVTKNYVNPLYYAGIVVQGSLFIEGSNLSTLYAYRWAGLDPGNGEARVFINGIPNNDLSYAASFSDMFNAKEIGSSVPVYFGNLGNAIRYAGFTLNANIAYKLGYYQRRQMNDLFLPVNTMFYTNFSWAGAEYTRRWQKPGDELNTNVPSLDYARGLTNPYNDSIYQYADINTYRADNIRLQEINLSYSASKRFGILKGMRLYVNMPLNIILWRANKLGLDPDIYDFPTPRIYTFGFSTQFK